MVRSIFPEIRLEFRPKAARLRPIALETSGFVFRTSNKCMRRTSAFSVSKGSSVAKRVRPNGRGSGWQRELTQSAKWRRRRKAYSMSPDPQSIPAQLSKDRGDTSPTVTPSQPHVTSETSSLCDIRLDKYRAIADAEGDGDLYTDADLLRLFAVMQYLATRCLDQNHPQETVARQRIDAPQAPRDALNCAKTTNDKETRS